MSRAHRTGAAGEPEAEPEAEREDRAERLIAAPTAVVWAAIADPQRLARWWGPAGFRNTFEHIDLRVGGEWRFVMHGPDGTDYANHSRFLAVEPGRALVLEHFSGHHFILRITLEAAGTATRVHWRQTFDTAEHWQRIKAFVQPANQQNLDRMTAEVLGTAAA